MASSSDEQPKPPEPPAAAAVVAAAADARRVGRLAPSLLRRRGAPPLRLAGAAEVLCPLWVGRGGESGVTPVLTRVFLLDFSAPHGGGRGGGALRHAGAVPRLPPRRRPTGESKLEREVDFGRLRRAPERRWCWISM